MDHQFVAKYKFGPYLLEPAERRLLTSDGTSVDLTVKAFDLLVLLVSNGGRLVTKEELLNRIWPDLSVAESNLTTTISMLRKALGENPQQRFIETVPKKGYRFVAEIQNNADPSDLATGQPPPIAHYSKSSGTNWQIYMVAGLVLAGLVTAITMWLFHPDRSQGADDLYRRASKLERNGNDKLALADLNEVLRIKPGFSEASLKAAWIAYQDDADDEAAKYIKEAPSASPAPEVRTAHERCTRLKTEGLQLLLSGDGNNALSKFQLATEADPSDTDALYYFSAIATDAGLIEDAERSLLKCLTLEVNNPFCRFQIIEIRVDQNRFDDAIAEYDRASQQGMVYPWLEEPAGFAELARGNVDAALVHFRRLEEAGRELASNVHFRASQDGIAAVDLYEGKLEDARSQIVSALQTSSSAYDKASYSLFLARIDVVHGRIDEAQSELQGAIDIPLADDLAVTEARLLAMVGNYAAARELLGKQKSGLPMGKPYAAAYQFVNGVEDIILKHDSNRGIAELEDAYRFDPDPEIAYVLAQAQMRAKRWPEAIPIFEKLLDHKGSVLMNSISSLVPLAEYNIAVCYERQGDRKEAERHFVVAEAMWNQASPDLKRAIARR